MPSINYGIKKARAAEVKRGLVFRERFKSQAEVEKNGGVVVGTVASYPDVFRVKTVIAKLKSAQAGSMTVKINSSQTITITAGNLFGSYDNATAFDADDIQINDWNQFEFVMIFRNQLSTEEKTAYQNGTMWTYDQNCVLWMDGKLRRYDPDNNRHIDASRAGNNLTFGDGTTATTFPTKLTERGGGYSFDGGDYMKFTKTLSGSYTIIVDFIPTISNAGFYICDFRTSGGTGYVWLPTDVITPSSGTVFLNDVQDTALRIGQRNCIAIQGITIASTVNIMFARNSLSSGLIGKVKGAAMFSGSINQIQIIDVMLRMQNPEV